jgi:hypothetical protein
MSKLDNYYLYLCEDISIDEQEQELLKQLLSLY